MKKMLFLIPILFIFCGCYNYNELNTLAITTGMSIDYDKEKKEFEVSLLIANSKKAQVSSKEGESQTVVLKAKGETISEAFNQVELEIPKKIYIGHLNVIVISESIARDGMKPVLDFLLREPESIKRFYLVISKEKDKAGEILKILSPLETFPSQNIMINLTTAKETQSIATAVPYSQFIDDLLKKGENPILSSIEIVGDEKDGSKEDSLKQTTPSANLKLGPIVLFKGDKLVGYTSEDESRGINLMYGNLAQTIIATKCNGGKVISDLTEIKSSIKVHLEDNTPKVDITIKASGSLQEISCNQNIEDPKVIKELEKKAEQRIIDLMGQGLKVSQKYKTDVLGIGNCFYKKYPNYYKKVNWDDDVFPELSVTMHVDINLQSKGSIEKVIKDGEHEE